MTDSTSGEPDFAELERLFRPRLERELDELCRQSQGTEADRRPVELDQQSVGRLSRMDSMQVQAMANAVEQRRRNRRSLIVRALARLDGGDFGHCLSCDEFVGLRRLEVDPASVLCVECARSARR